MATRVVKRTKHGSTALAPQKRERIDLDEDFSDVSGDPNSGFMLVDAEGRVVPPEGDATRHYIFAHNSADQTSGVTRFKNEKPGYEIVYFEKDGVRPAGAEAFLKEGDQIVVSDHVLMSCDRALHEKRGRYERHKTAIQNHKMAVARQSDVNLDDDRTAGVRQRVGLNYRDDLKA